MRFNAHGIVGFCAITGMAAVALTRKGSYIPAIVLLIVLYGAALLGASAATESKKFARGESLETKAYAKNLAQVWIIALHFAFLLILGTFFLGFQNQPAINLIAAPLALLVSYCILGLALDASTDGVKLNLKMTAAAIPVLVLTSVAAIKSWSPLWYPYAALTLYSVLLLARMKGNFPWGRRRWDNYYEAGGYVTAQNRTGMVLFHSAKNDRWQIGIYFSLALISLGFLIDVSGINRPNWFHPSNASFYHTLLRILIFLGCAVVGLVLPLLLLTEKDPSQA